MHVLHAWIRWQDRLSEWLGRLVAWLGFALVCILVFEVASRQLLRSPTNWAHEASTLTYGVYAILAGAYTEKWHGHVRIDIFYQRLSQKGQALVSLLIGVLTLVLLTLLLESAYDFAMQSVAMQERSLRSTWAPIIWPVKVMIPVAVLLIMLQMLANTLRHLCTLLGHPVDSDPSATDTRRDSHGEH
ncbi:TRAP transporter small permease subunit [Halomonas urumqiensis]|uniref:TRAP transporter small permease protein n=1 Tax=Halomonas urumqiensis TaxID=1684789 RepID=A0A2N7UCT1_9GAMM|nr:TRAP transporter small permease subunit [Halomonas urumqiensis]PMR78185.1 C4-dicarboxylate ABC transporter substrate-binding protein [Halomonas urumqiensis]PTB03334.1 C4-dicarboxylate ABC transporter substrate-binding protein [Halomonas urumqiensis]GHE20502.1 transporter DctQ-related protein [Halomonas urumqiensis]